jgi:hypothetical protein
MEAAFPFFSVSFGIPFCGRAEVYYKEGAEKKHAGGRYVIPLYKRWIQYASRKIFI